MSSRARGFTLLETMIALVVLAITSLGTLSAMVAASRNLKEGQIRQSKAALVEARTQLLMMADKSQLGTSASNALFGTLGTFTPGTPPDKLPIGASPWQLDPTGAFFTADASGVVNPTTSAATSCAPSGLAPGILCREVALTAGLPDGSSPHSGTAYTLWTRVIRSDDGSPLSFAVVDRMVVLR